VPKRFADPRCQTREATPAPKPQGRHRRDGCQIPHHFDVAPCQIRGVARTAPHKRVLAWPWPSYAKLMRSRNWQSLAAGPRDCKKVCWRTTRWSTVLYDPIDARQGELFHALNNVFLAFRVPGFAYALVCARWFAWHLSTQFVAPQYRPKLRWWPPYRQSRRPLHRRQWLIASRWSLCESEDGKSLRSPQVRLSISIRRLFLRHL
jgi:hypothetical protein